MQAGERPKTTRSRLGQQVPNAAAARENLVDRGVFQAHGNRYNRGFKGTTDANNDAKINLMNSTDAGNPADWPASPCIGVCEFDDAEGLCLGCGRTMSEISNWLGLDAGARAAVFEQLADRLERLKEKQLRSHRAGID